MRLKATELVERGRGRQDPITKFFEGEVLTGRHELMKYMKEAGEF